MKNYLVIISILFGFTSTAQIYHPFPTKNVIWSERYTNSHNPFPYSNDIFHYFTMKGNDTTINGKLYHKLYNSEDTTFTEKNLCGGIREENKRVYFYAIDSVWYSLQVTFPSKKSEFILYDFSLTLGDTLKKELYQNPVDCYVVNLDSIYIGNEYRKRYTFGYGPNNPLQYLQWIEGIGSLRGFLVRTIKISMSSGWNDLICFRQNNEILYHNSGYDECFYKNDYNSINDNKAVKEITIEPNPVSTTCKLSYTENYNQIQIVNMFGIVVREYNVNGQTSTIVDRYGLPSGIYFIKLNGRGVVGATIKAIFD